MQWLAEICVKRPVFAWVLSMVILVIGGGSYLQLGVDQFPKIDFPVVVVTTVQPGSSPEDIERDITDKIEGAVNTISSIDELRSDSSEGVSRVAIQFKLEKSVDVAVNEVQQKVSAVLGELPRGIDPPSVTKIDPDATPILYLAVQAPNADVRAITDIADRIVRRRLESVSGVGQVTIIGGRKRQVNVSVDPLKLKAMNISPLEVAQAIGAQNTSLPGGRVDTSRDYLSLRVEGRVENIDELKAIIVRDSNGRTIRLDEVATVEDSVEDAATAARWNGAPTVVLALRKQSGTNTVQVVDAVKDRISDFEKGLPAGYSLAVQRDGSAVIRTGTHAVQEHLLLGAVFAALIVLLFLGNLRSTIIAALAIPTSIVGTFALMKLMGYTLNTITLLALALAVGIVIDDAIVVLENIFKFIDEKGMTPMEAAVEGTREIGLAVMATTLSLIAVFLPIAFVAGIPGRFLASFGVTMSFSVAVSLFVSFSLTPMMASRWLGPNPKSLMARLLLPISKPIDALFTAVVNYGYRPLERLYVGLLRFCMSQRWVVVLASCMAIGSCFPLVKVARKGFLPVDDRAQFEVLVRLPEGRSVAATELMGERVARIIRDRPEVMATLLTVGDDAQRTPNLARIYVKMTSPEQRTTTQNQFKDIVRSEILSTLPPDLKLSIADVDDFGGGRSTARIQYLMAGPDLATLVRESPRLIKEMGKLPGIVDLDSSLVVGKPELGVYIDRNKAADLGVQVVDVAQALQYLVAGLKVSTYSEQGEQFEIRLRATPEFRSSEDALRFINVPSRKLGLVSLADVVTIRSGESPTTISRYQRERQVTFVANAKPGVSEGDLGQSIKEIMDKTALTLPKGFSVAPQGQTKIMRETGISFALGLLASLVFMFLILAAQFESWLHPVTILSSLPLTLPFAVMSIVIFDSALDMFSVLGIFVLFGVVKKNGILQVDHTNHLRSLYADKLEAARRLMEKDPDGAFPGEHVAQALHVEFDQIIGAKQVDWVLGTKKRFTISKAQTRLDKAIRLKALLDANRDRLRPILMTTLAFVAGMVPLVTSKGIGAGFNRATAGVVVGGQALSLLLTLLAVPVVYSFIDDLILLSRRLLKAARLTEKEEPSGPSGVVKEAHS